MKLIIFLSLLVTFVTCGPATESYKDQFCTDPRTMRRHKAYTEWADAYSCSRHRCQPGGRNLAIYTVGCKRVEAPESAIECEEVVEDTNMQFPYCCTRLRCLVVVRGEVWTRVLGQPWETLPAAPWSHMYKMKKPPPSDSNFIPKTGPTPGPVYELGNTDNEKVMRASEKADSADCDKTAARASDATPDIIIALDTEKPKKTELKEKSIRHKRVQKSPVSGGGSVFEPEPEPRRDSDTEAKDKSDIQSDERFSIFAANQKSQSQAEIPSSQWNERDNMDGEGSEKDVASQSDKDLLERGDATDEGKEEKPSKLQTLVDAIGTRMRDIENVVQRMTEKVQEEGSHEKRQQSDTEHLNKKEKIPNSADEHYNRFTVKSRSKYVHTVDGTTEVPLFIEDTNLNGYFSDAANNVLRRSGKSLEPTITYMAPVETRRNNQAQIQLANESSDHEKKHKKHSHKKKKGKRQGHKKHHGKDKERRRFNKLSAEIERNVVSLEDASAPGGN